MNNQDEAMIIAELKKAYDDLKNSKTIKIKHQGVEKDIKDITPEEKAKLKATIETLKQNYINADYIEVTRQEDGGLSFTPKKKEVRE
jgi:protein tyrosine phosphatase